MYCASIRKQKHIHAVCTYCIIIALACCFGGKFEFCGKNLIKVFGGKIQNW